MMGLVRGALRRPYTVIIFSLLILMLGGLAITRMIVDFFPKIDIPVVFVAWSYPGLSAEDMERRVVIVSERGISTTVNGVERIESTAIPGIGLIKVFFHPGTDVGASISQINSVLNTVLRILPPGMSPPIIIPFNAASVPVVQMTVQSKTLPEEKIFDYGFNFIRVKLFTIPGLSVPSPFGGRQRQIMVELDPTRLQAKGLSAADVVTALQNSNLILPAGTARIGVTDYNILMNSSPPTVELFNQIPVRVVNGIPILMGDVAKVSDGFAVQNNIVHVDGRRATYLTILKHPSASSLAVVNAAREILPEIQAAAPEGIELRLDFDQSVFVRSAIRNVTSEAIIAAALVSLMILLFLGSWRNTLVVATSIPLSVFASIIGLYLTGNTINLLTLGGLALATGILVDDATVAVENIHRHRAMGKPLTVAILDGSREVALPRTVATLAICIVFFPVVFLYGVAKFLFIPLALTVVFALLASYILSFTVVPVLSRYLLIHEKHNPNGKGLAAAVNRVRENILNGMTHVYGGVLNVILRHRVFVLLVFLIVLVASAGLVRVVGTDFFPTTDVGLMKLHVRAPIGTRIEETEKMVLAVEDTIRKIIPEHELQTINDMVGVPIFFNLAFVPSDNISGMDAEILISLKSPHRPVAEYMREMRKRLPEQFPGAGFYFQNADIVSQVLNFGLPAPIDIQVQDSNFERAQGVAKKIKDAIALVPGVVDERIVQVLDYPALKVEVDRLRAARLGISQRDVANSMLTTLSSSSIVAPSYWLNPANGVNYLVAVQAPLDKASSVDQLMAMPVTPGGPRPAEGPARLAAFQAPPNVKLSAIASMTPQASFQSVSHYTVQRVIDIAANIDKRDLGGVLHDIEAKLEPLRKDLAKNTKILVRGQGEVMESSFQSLALGLVLAIVLVYALMVVLFQSWVDPFIIIMAVPGSLIGILWILALTGSTINVQSLMGSIMAVGIGVANSILVVSFANELRATHHLSAIEAAVEAGKTRLRAVLMTALAMVIGMVPMALGIGEAAEQNAPLGRAVIGGLIVATLTTLFVVPVFYTLLRKKPPTLHQLDERFLAESEGAVG